MKISGTRINKLILEGFKSFGKRTEFLFGPDFNCVVGPNGSGKSNIIDAVCFVLGKTSAKSMRATNSANLIYNGGKTHAPGKQAEVTIVFDNSEKTFPTPDTEVKLTRTVRSDGQSKYKINGKVRTREEMLDLMSIAKINPDGHNIVLQGDIVHFCQMPPVERRQIIEEIAGIGMYEERKQSALRDLEKVEERLNQAEIILKEREGYIKDLKKDRDQALKYKELSDNIKSSKGSYLKIQMNKKEAGINEVLEKSGKHKKRFEELTAKITKMREDITQKRNELTMINAEVEQKGEKDMLMLQKEIETLRVDQTASMSKQQSIKQEIGRIAQRKTQLANNLTELDGKIVEMEERKKTYTERHAYIVRELGFVEQHLADFKKKHNIADDTSKIEENIHSLDAKSEEKAKEQQQISEARQNLMREQDVINFKLQTIDEQINKVKNLNKEHEQEIEALKQKKEEFKKAVLELNKILNDDSRMAAELANGRQSALRMAEELAKLEVKQAAVQESIAGNMAVKKIIENKSKIGGVYGTVAELGQVNTKYSLALEIAASSRIHSIVVDDDKIAAKCIQYLKDNRFGIATFLPLNKITAPPLKSETKKLCAEKGVYGMAIDLIQYDPKFKTVFQYVFGNTLIVDNINTARKIGVGVVKMVTLEGDVCELAGSMTGGHRGKSVGAFKDDDVNSRVDRVNEDIAEMQAKLSRLDRDKKENEEHINKLREFKANLEGDIIRTEKSLHLDTSDLDASKDYKRDLAKRSKDIEKEMDYLVEKQNEKTREVAGLKTERQKLIDTLTSMRNPRLQAELNTFSEKRRELENEKIVIETEMKNLEQQRTEFLGKEATGTKDVMKALDKEHEDFKAEEKKLTASLKQLESSLKVKDKEQEKFQSRFKELFTKSKKLNDEITGTEKKSFEIEDESHKEEIKLNTYSIEEARIKAEHAGIAVEFEQYSGVPLNLDKSEEDLKKEIADFEKMRANVGSVNMRALDIYDTAAKEFESLVLKKNTLLTEKESVVLLMNEIEVKKKTLFIETFERIHNDYKRIFAQLTTKGDVELVIENPESPFEGGLDIKVRLMGNKFLDMRSLSGGEKTLTALAFIFAIQEYSPASFYVLDEVDAALDKHNAEKLGQLVKQYSGRAQYVVISHNDNVISEADTLYGVSLGDHGISKVVSLQI